MARPRQSPFARPHGTVVRTVRLTLTVGPDDAVLAALAAAPNISGFVMDALRTYVNRFESLAPEQRFRHRKDGRLILPVTLEFYPKRDNALIRAIEAAPAEAVEAAIVELMRSGGSAGPALAAEAEEMDVVDLGMDL